MRLQATEERGAIRLYRHHGTGAGPFLTVGEDVELQTVNYSGHTFADFYPSQAPEAAPGWFVFGRNSEKYGTNKDGRGSYVMLCARPAVKARRHPHYNCQVQRGFKTRREAQAVADLLNAKREG